MSLRKAGLHLTRHGVPAIMRSQKKILFLMALWLASTSSQHAGISDEMEILAQETEKAVSPLIGSDGALAVSELVVPASTEETERVAYAVSEYLTETLAQQKKFRVIEKKQISRILHALEFSQSGVTDAESAEVIGKLVGAKQMLLGSLSLAEERYTIALRLVEIKTGQIRWARTFVVSAKSGAAATTLYHPPAFRLHVSMALNYYGQSYEATALHTLGMGFGYRYNVAGRHWAGFQANPWFYHFYWSEFRRDDGQGNSVNFYLSARNAIELMPGYVYRLPVTRFLALNFGIYGGAMVYSLYESHQRTGNGTSTNFSRTQLMAAPILFPQFEVAIMDTQAFSFFIRLSYFFLFKKMESDFAGIAYSQYPMGGRLDGGVAFYY